MFHLFEGIRWIGILSVGPSHVKHYTGRGAPWSFFGGKVEGRNAGLFWTHLFSPAEVEDLMGPGNP